ncbi:hypothetical protein H8N03_04075 [Ramlibacter sp. USB13]|uniref:DUF2066 domain-containing protein n=1 Tax=Ramlibacter cellulosilyticus TaxID=2764187 RepID=A0A923S9U1_9BURK|nr:hypothetical protein [Ramlibacter cellulosilyticus]MBC5782109.1 hypothetical protein [Ramlibacter cellulosilyticus]
MSRPSDAARALLAAGALASSGAVFALAGERFDAGVHVDVAVHDGEPLEALRVAAALDADARNLLSRRLLDRFESGGDKADLREALHWIARDWDQQAFLRSGPVNRKVVSDCERPVLRWYWVCGAE